MENEYEVKGITTSIRFTSRASVKIADNFYTIEACEERVIPDIEDVDIEEERKALWDTVNNEVDEQIEDILKTFKKK
jgi:hypothetical protein